MSCTWIHDAANVGFALMVGCSWLDVVHTAPLEGGTSHEPNSRVILNT